MSKRTKYQSVNTNSIRNDTSRKKDVAPEAPSSLEQGI
jgi:hypothetical protein